MTEAWMPVIIPNRPEYSGLYSVSSLGRIRSDRANKNILRPHTGRGYMVIGLTASPCSQLTQRMHRLVAQAFIPNPENKREVNHKNGIRADNRVKNLEWMTRHENMRHAFKFIKRNIAKGERIGTSKLTAGAVKDMRARWESGEITRVDLAKQYGISPRSIRDIVHRKTWGHVE